MAYMHLVNLYKNQEILMLKEVYASEKIHGSSANIGWKDGKVTFFSGGAKRENFVSLFDEEILKEKFIETDLDEVVLFGEVCGGKMQAMSHTYGKTLMFIVFDVKIGNIWLNVPNAENFTKKIGLEFIPYEKITTDMVNINAERDKPSRVAKRIGIEEDKISEGIVLRPLIELKKNNGARIMCKHKRDEFRETRTPRKVDPEKLKSIAEAKAIVEEWVTFNRLNNIFSHMENVAMENMGVIIKAMIEDVKREGEGEIVWSKVVEKQIGKTTAQMVTQYFKKRLEANNE